MHQIHYFFHNLTNSTMLASKYGFFNALGPTVKLQPYDILCDETKNIDHVGNRRLTITMYINYEKYASAKTEMGRRAVATLIVETVASSFTPGGRFLRSGEGIDNFDIVERKEAIEWVHKSMARLLSEKTANECASLSIPHSLAEIKTRAALERDGKDIDGSLAALLLKQHHIFTSLANTEESNKKKGAKRKKRKSNTR